MVFKKLRKNSIKMNLKWFLSTIVAYRCLWDVWLRQLNKTSIRCASETFMSALCICFQLSCLLHILHSLISSCLDKTIWRQFEDLRCLKDVLGPLRNAHDAIILLAWKQLQLYRCFSPTSLKFIRMLISNYQSGHFHLLFVWYTAGMQMKSNKIESLLH